MCYKEEEFKAKLRIASLNQFWDFKRPEVWVGVGEQTGGGRRNKQETLKLSCAMSSLSLSGDI